MIRSLVYLWILITPVMILWIMGGNSKDRKAETQHRKSESNARKDWIRLKVRRANKRRSWV